MALFSKMYPAAEHISCRTMVHPYTDSCVMGALDMFFSSSKGTIQFMGILYLVSLEYLILLITFIGCYALDFRVFRQLRLIAVVS